jgi:hypothetical protein
MLLARHQIIEQLLLTSDFVVKYTLERIGSLLRGLTKGIFTYFSADSATLIKHCSPRDYGSLLCTAAQIKK